MYTAQITGFPVSQDPTQSIVEATLTDDSGALQIVRNYSLPTANDPTPADFETLITADVTALNSAATTQASFAAQFTNANLSIPVAADADPADDTASAAIAPTVQASQDINNVTPPTN
jgi:hypothetical protein